MMGLPSCREVAALLSREQDDTAPTPRSLSLRLHLLMCRHCRRYERQLTWLRRSFIRVRANPVAPKLPAHTRARIRKRLRRHDDFHSPPG
ncbi:MAG: hypothetical protein PF501_05345 [Salinisphaera sp.]|jgi:predicted anti-sigma-YlaC factor YlaD|nr:hypothetical protein [Salinisphaera sp.]